jgi:hypothetical protein
LRIDDICPRPKKFVVPVTGIVPITGKEKTHKGNVLNQENIEQQKI